MARDAFRGPRQYPSPLSDESPLLAAFDPERAFELTTPAGTGARLADVATPEEREAGIRAATDAERARRVAEARRTPSVRASEDLAAELQSDPRFAFMSHGLDTATMGLDDEIIAAGLSGMSDLGMVEGPDLEYRDVQRALDEATANASEESPWASRLGTVAGVGATLPLAELLVPAAPAGATGLARLAPLARPTAIGAGLGGVGGALGAEPGQRLQGALEGAAMGGAFGALGGGMATLGRGVRAAYPGVMGTTLGGAAEGAGYGILAAPGTMREPITDQDAALRAGTQGATVGGVLGGALGAASNLFTQPARYLSGAGGRVEAQTQPLVPSAPIVDDTAAEFAAMDDVTGLADDSSFVAPIGGPSPREAAEAAMAARANRSPMRRLWDETVAADPATKRWHSMGVTQRRDLRGVERGFGSLEAGTQALNEAGLAMPGTRYATRTAREGARAANERATAMLEQIHQRVAASGQPMSRDAIADEIERVAESYVTGVQSPRTTDLIAALRSRADDFRYGTGMRPSTATESLIDEATGLPVEADVAALPNTPELTYPDLRRAMSQEAAANAPFLTGATLEPTPQQLASRDVYRALAGERNQAIERAGLMGEYQPSNRVFRATQAVMRAPYEQMAPAEFRAMIGGAASASGPADMLGRGLGWLRERAIGQYQDSALATLNELGGASREEIYQRAATMALESPSLSDDVRRELQAIAGGTVPSGSDAARIFDRAVEGSSGAGRLAAARAKTLVAATDSAPFLMQRFRDLASVNPESANAFARRVDDAAMSGALTGAELSAQRSSEEVERELSDAERAPDVDDSTIRERDRAFGRMLGVTGDEPTAEPAEATPEVDESTRERDRSFGARLTGRGR